MGIGIGIGIGIGHRDRRRDRGRVTLETLRPWGTQLFQLSLVPLLLLPAHKCVDELCDEEVHHDKVANQQRADDKECDA